MFNLKYRKLLKLMEKNKEYTVSEIWKLLYIESGYYEQYDIFYRTIILDLEYLHKVKINRDFYTYKIKKI